MIKLVLIENKINNYKVFILIIMLLTMYEKNNKNLTI